MDLQHFNIETDKEKIEIHHFIAEDQMLLKDLGFQWRSKIPWCMDILLDKEVFLNLIVNLNYFILKSV